jgi:DNA repair exonuclease SbcCD nuclease subunit
MSVDVDDDDDECKQRRVVIDYVSDVHIEFRQGRATKLRRELGSFLRQCCNDDDDKKHILVLAGDVGNILNTNRDINHGYLDTLRMFCRYWTNIVLVMGNHEYYGARINHDDNDNPLSVTEQLLRNAIANDDVLSKRIHMLQRQTVEIHGIVFVGCTLWTRADHADFHNMSDCRQVFNHRISTLWSLHARHRDWLSSTLEQLKGQCVVVVTHHLPTKQLIHAKYARMSSSGYVADDCTSILTDFASTIRAWICGHTHETMRVKHESSGVECMTNPLGYPGEDKQTSITNQPFEIL